jgi:hypothetical protein
MIVILQILFHLYTGVTDISCCDPRRAGTGSATCTGLVLPLEIPEK